MSVLNRQVKSSVYFLIMLASIWSLPLLAKDYFDGWLGFAGNFDVAYRKTQFFESEHNVAVGIWDSRIELWLPPHKKDESGLSWGPYFRMAGISSSSKEAWENGWLALPGIGFQVYPFSLAQFRKDDSLVGKVFGPLRLMFEYNWLNYWGSENSWRPTHQIRTGAEYWRTHNVNKLDEFWWGEIWGGLHWVSANEFDPNYDSLTFAASIRSGLRLPIAATKNDLISMVSPYVALESSVNKNSTYYWENRLLIGGGLRLTPPLEEMGMPKWFNRLVVYAEYDHVVAYYQDTAYSIVPNYDVRVGVNFSLGDWYPDFNQH